MPTRSDIRTQIRRLLNETDTANTHFSDAFLNDLIEQWNRELQARFEFDRSVATVTTVLDQANYTLPTNFQILKEIYLQDNNSKETWLDLLDHTDMYRRFGSQWREDASGVPIVAYLVDYNILGVHPKPNAANASKTIRIFYIPQITALTDGSSPVFPEVLHDSCKYYAASIAHFSLGNVQLASAFKNIYDGMIQEHKHYALKFADGFMGFKWGGISTFKMENSL